MEVERWQLMGGCHFIVIIPAPYSAPRWLREIRRIKIYTWEQLNSEGNAQFRQASERLGLQHVPNIVRAVEMQIYANASTICDEC